MEMVSQGCGAIHGASRLSRTMLPTMASPAFSCAGMRRGAGARLSSDSSAIADLWIEPGVEKIGNQVGECVNGGHDQNGSLQRWQIPLLDGKNEQPPETRIGKDRFDHDNAAHQPADVEGKYRDCG